MGFFSPIKKKQSREIQEEIQQQDQIEEKQTNTSYEEQEESGLDLDTIISYSKNNKFALLALSYLNGETSQTYNTDDEKKDTTERWLLEALERLTSEGYIFYSSVNMGGETESDILFIKKEMK